MSDTPNQAAGWLAGERIERILFVHFGGIGDAILAFAALKTLRETFPSARIIMLVEPRARGIGAFNPVLDEVLTFDVKARPSLGEFVDLVGQLRSRAFDLAIASGRSSAMAGLLWFSGARHRVGFAAGRLAWTLTFAVPLNPKQYAGEMIHDLVAEMTGRQSPAPAGSTPVAPSSARVPQLAVSPEDRAWATEFLAQRFKEGDRLAVLHPGASLMAARKGIHKTWDARNWAELARELRRGGLKIVLAGGPDDATVIGQVQALLAGLIQQDSDGYLVAYEKTRNLGQLAALIQQAAVLVAVDSAPMHVGISVGTPTVAVFGPTDPDKLMPAGTVHQAVYVTGLACRPCLWDRRQTTCSDLTCLKTLSVDLVAQAVWRVEPQRLLSEDPANA